MNQSDNGAGCKADILESNPDIEQHEYGCNGGCHNSVPLHLSTYGAGNTLGDDLRLIHAKVLCQGCIQSLTLLHAEGSCLDDNLCGSCNLLGLGVGASCYLFNNWNHFA